MNITFWVTERCNLACKYCYVHKQPKTMTLETAEQTIKYFTDKFDETVAAGKRINVALHGGEPLLNFDVIRYIVETLKERYDGHIIFTMTTNGTVFEKDIYDFIKGKVQISVSIDGNRTTNDTNRIYPNGESSFDKVMETLKFLKEQGEYIRVRMTVNKETLPFMAENYIYLDQMEMGVVTFALDAGVAWNQQDMQIYYENYEKIMEYMIEKDKKAAQYLLFNIKEATFRRRTGCDGGTNTFHISADGGIYPCALAADKVDYCLAVSEFNKQNLIDMGYKCDIDVLPIIIPMSDYDKKPDKDVIKEYSDGYTNILFTGRVAPNKKHENLIAAFYYYNRLYNNKSRLILAGSYKENDPYYIRLTEYTKKLGLGEAIVFTGHIKFNQILAYYKTADVFLCMSEHEGFCVPLVEAMKFKVPIIAYDKTAIADTMGYKGMIIDDNNPVYVAGCIDRVVRDKELRQQLVNWQNERLQSFEYNNIAEMFKKYLRDFINKNSRK